MPETLNRNMQNEGGHHRARVSIMITTHNRLLDLQRTLAALQQFDPAPREILITADNCKDGTVEFLEREFPDIKLIINAVGRGSVASRDRMIREATGDLVLSLDDDSYPEQSDCLERMARLFVERPNLAVAHFPQHTDEYPDSLSQTDFGKPQLTRSFANSGACFRRATYLQLPGFEPRFFHAYEEPDYALQCTAAGFEVYYSPTVTIRHHWSGKNRSEWRIHQQHARNEMWSMAMRCPFPFVLPMILCKMLSQLRTAIVRGPAWFLREPIWWWRALEGLPPILSKRQPFPWRGYWRWLCLKDKQWLDVVATNRSFWKERNKVRAAK